MDTKYIRYLSLLGARGVLGQALLDMAEEGKEFFAVSADLARSSGFERLEAKYPECCVNTGIAEQAMLGMAAGLSRYGTSVYATSWAVFSTLRIADQMRNYMGSMSFNIKLIGLDSGLTKADWGVSHSNPQDIALFRSQPGVRIVAPSDGQMLYKAIVEMQKDDIPTYLRMTGGERLPVIYKKDMPFGFGETFVAREGKDITIFATGAIISETLKTAAILEEEGIECEIVDICTLKPFDYNCISSRLERKLFVTVEEHSIYGGLGGIVAEYLSELKERPRLLICGIPDEIMVAQDYQEALEYSGLSAKKIAERILIEYKNEI